MRAMVGWMQQQRWLLAYAWHDSGVGSSALLDPSGQLTALGMVTYSAQLRKQPLGQERFALALKHAS